MVDIVSKIFLACGTMSFVATLASLIFANKSTTKVLFATLTCVFCTCFIVSHSVDEYYKHPELEYERLMNNCLRDSEKLSDFLLEHPELSGSNLDDDL